MSTPITGLLPGVWAKIERAKQHIRDLERHVNAFHEPTRNILVTELDLDTGEVILRFQHPGPLSEEIPLVVGDAVHNMRSALDHLVCHFALKSQATDLQPFSFPVYQSKPRDEAQFRRKVHGIDQRAVSLIESLQPYKGGDSALWTLTELDNFDKHRLLVVAAVRVGDFWYGGTGGDMLRPGPIPANGSAALRFKVTAAPHSGSKAPVFLQDGDELGRFLPSAGLKKNAYAGCSLSIAFREPKIVEGEPVMQLLAQLLQLVEGMVKQFVPFL